MNRNVLSRCLKTSSDCAYVTCDSRSFQLLAPETGNTGLPTVEKWTAGTSSQSDVEDCSHRLEVMSVMRVKHDCRYPGGAVDGSVGQNSLSE